MSTRTNIRTATANALTGALVVPTANILKGRNNTIASISFPAAADRKSTRLNSSHVL